MEPDEINDIELATQLSLLDLDDEKGKKHVADGDKELARAIKESLESSSYSKQRSQTSSSSSRRSSSTIDCDVCNKELLPGMSYCNLDFWNQRFCSHHFSDGTPICTGCLRAKLTDVEYLNVGDGRKICPDCYSSSSVKYTQQIEPLIRSVLQFYKEKGMQFKEQVSVFLVTRNEMRRQRSGRTSPGSSHSNDFTLGLTVTHPSGSIDVNSVTSSSLRGKQVTVEENNYHVPGSKATIMVLYGLPMYMTGVILSHEMMHAWLRTKGIRVLEQKIEEGISQVMGYEWLNWFESKEPAGGSYSSSEQAQYAKNLKKFYKQFVEIDPSVAYGDGFRDAKHSVAKYGLLNVIKHLKKYGTIPN